MAESDRMPAYATRLATLDDVPVLTETQRLGFEGYVAFSPPGWAPPPSETEARGIAARLSSKGVWCVIAYTGDEPAGHVGFLEADEPGLAHVWALFIREPFWGTGLA